MSEVKNKRIGEMELWRFIFSVIIVFHHSRRLVGNENALFFNGAYAVEFFFILSGYLLMQSIDRVKSSTGSIGKDTFLFIKKKYLSLCPDLFISWILGAAVTIGACGYTFIEAGNFLAGGIWEMGLLHMGGLNPQGLNSAVWYLSSMLIAMAILYPILRKYKDGGRLVAIPLAVLLLFGYLYAEFGSLRVPFGWTGWTFRGNLRAIADLGLGVICYGATQRFAALPLNHFAKGLLTVAKYGCYAALIAYMYGKQSNVMDFFLLLVIMLAILLTFSRQTLGQQIFNNKFIAFLGKYSLPLYLSHYWWVKVLNIWLPGSMSAMEKTIVYMAMALASGGLVMALSALWKKLRPARLLKQCFYLKEV